MDKVPSLLLYAIRQTLYRKQDTSSGTQVVVVVVVRRTGPVQDAVDLSGVSAHQTDSTLRRCPWRGEGLVKFQSHS